MYSSRVILNETEPREDPGFFLGGCASPGADYSAPRLLAPLRNGVTDWSLTQTNFKREYDEEGF